MSLRRRVHAGASEDLTSLVSSADMPNPSPKTETELLEEAKHLAGQLSDQRTITLFLRLVDRGRNTLR